MVEVHGFCDDRFAPLGALFRAGLEHGSDEGAAFATNLDQVTGIHLLCGGDLKKPFHPFQERHARGDVRKRIVKAFISHAGPVSRFDVALGPNFVRV